MPPWVKNYDQRQEKLKRHAKKDEPSISYSNDVLRALEEEDPKDKKLYDLGVRSSPEVIDQHPDRRDDVEDVINMLKANSKKHPLHPKI